MRKSARLITIFAIMPFSGETTAGMYSMKKNRGKQVGKNRCDPIYERYSFCRCLCCVFNKFRCILHFLAGYIL